MSEEIICLCVAIGKNRGLRSIGKLDSPELIQWPKMQFGGFAQERRGSIHGNQ